MRTSPTYARPYSEASLSLYAFIFCVVTSRPRFRPAWLRFCFCFFVCVFFGALLISVRTAHGESLKKSREAHIRHCIASLNASDACPFERPVRGKELGPTGAALPPHHTHHRLCRRLAQLEKLLFRCADNALWLESEMPCHVLRGRGQTETAEPDDGALTARITLPAERRSGLHGDTRLDIGWNHLVAIGAILSLE